MSDKYIPGGYVLQPRKLDDSETMKAPPIVRELFQYIIRKVNHEDSGSYKRGQGFFNLGDIQEDLCWYVGYRKMKYSKPQLTKSIRRLCGSNTLATMKATRGLYITVLNYDEYQNPKNYESNDEGHTKETRKKREGHTKNKNDKNERIKNKEYIYPDFFTDGIKELWKEFKKYRTKIKAPLTEYAEKLALVDLQKQVKDGFDPSECINQTIKSGKWKTFYPVKNNNFQPQSSRPQAEPGKYENLKKMVVINE